MIENKYSKFMLVPGVRNNNINKLLNDKALGTTDKIYNMKTVLINKKNNKHYAAANKEWINSVYAYNKNYIKTLPSADITINNMLRDYLNIIPLTNGKKLKVNAILEKRLSLNKILVSKAEVKHTSDKIGLTVYVYNRSKISLLRKLRKHMSSSNLFNESINIKSYKKRLLKAMWINKYLNKKSILLQKIKELKTNLMVSLNISNNLYNENFSAYEKKFMHEYTALLFENELLCLYYAKALSINNNRFKNWFLLALKNKISQLYNKKVELNIVNQKYFYFNSDIMVKALSTRIRDRNNSITILMKKILKGVILPSRSKYRGNLSHFNAFNLNKTITSAKAYKNKELLNNMVFDSIKYKRVLGIRLEAAGRLSKRLTASRSIFKLVYKGGLRNKDMLKTNDVLMFRGIAKPNIQYTNLNSKTRNGAFGLKGWINSN